MRKEALAVMVVLVVGLAFAAGFGAEVSNPRTITTVSTSIVTSVSTVTQVNTVTLLGGTAFSTATECEIIAFSRGVFIHVTAGLVPVAGANITVAIIGYCDNYGKSMLQTVYSVTTNLRGYASMCAESTGTCYLGINYSGVYYPLSVPLYPGSTSDVRFDLSSGNVTVTNCPGTQPCR